MNRTMDNDNEPTLYRPGVGIVLLNSQGLVFVGERIDNEGAWQLPQGGIDEAEEIEKAVFREMKEEIGTDNARIVGHLAEWLHYDIPYHISQRAFGGKYRGQKQKWFALEFLGRDEDINLNAHTQPEFGQWKWVTVDNLFDCVVPFKRDVYRQVMEAFEDIIEDLRSR